MYGIKIPLRFEGSKNDRVIVDPKVAKLQLI